MALGRHFTDDEAVLLSVRTEPAQNRSSERLERLLDAAAALVDEGGADRLTTADVAERAGASIGTVYRYFPDRLAVLAALRERATLRFRRQVADRLHERTPCSWQDLLDVVIDVCVELYRTEPGFGVVGPAHRDRALDEDEGVPRSVFAIRLAKVFEEAYALTDGAELRFALDICVEIGDALITRAFLVDAQGDARYIEECRRVLRGYLGDVFQERTGASSAA